MFSLRPSVFALAACFVFSATAFADAPPTATPAGTQQVTLPTGKTIDAAKFKDPTAGSIEAAIIESMGMIKAGNFDGWIAKYCDASTCPDERAVEALKTYQLKSSSKTVHECMTDDGGILVTKREANEAEGSTRVYVFCGPNRMPAPTSVKDAAGAWKFTSFSW